MKTAYLLFTIAGFGALTLGVSFATEPSRQGLKEKQTTSDRDAGHLDGKPERAGKEQAETKQSKSKEDGGASKNSSDAKNQTTSDRPAGQVRGNPTRGNGKETMERLTKSEGDIRPVEKRSQTGAKKKGILPLHRVGQKRPNPVAPNRGAARQKRIDNPQNKLPVVNDFHQPGLNRAFSPAAKDRLRMNTTGNPQQELARRLPVGGGANASLPSVVHVRPATASIGQLTPSSVKTSTAVINGTGMRHKP
jgi:hypothetical protein